MRNVVLLFIFALTYSCVVPLVPTLGFERWQAVALYNSLIVLVFSIAFRKKLCERLVPKASQGIGLLAWAAPFIVLAMVLGLIVISPQGPRVQRYSLTDLFFLVILIPIVEELLFRKIVTRWIHERFEDSFSIVLLSSATVFALAHAALPDLVVPLGPYLLGLVTTSLYLATGQVMTPILFHSACNASAILLSYYAPMWLDRLDFLYLKL